VFERFTDRSRRVVVAAQEEARRLRHNYIGTEHLLLGLLAEHDGIAARALTALGVTEASARDAISKWVPPGNTELSGHIPFTPRAKKVLELALREALALNHNYIGTEHIALGLLREGEGVAAQVLTEFGVGLPQLRQQVVSLLPAGTGAPAAPTASLPAASPAVQIALHQAREDAGQSTVASHQLVLALLADPNSAARQALSGAGVDIDAAVQALSNAKISGTTDETDEDRGRRGLRIRLDDDTLQLECTDQVLVELAATANLSQEGLSGEVIPELGEVWTALHNALKTLASNSAASRRPEAAPRKRRRPRRSAD
jgi:ATP-dependent Clp protease ATP-binding subunit ClpA